MFHWVQRYPQSPKKKKSEVKLTLDSNKKGGSTKSRQGRGNKHGKNGVGGDDEVWKCEECKVAYENDDDDLLSCSYCDTHWCTKCIEMSSEEYATAQRPDLFWFCPTCATKVKIFLGTGLIEQRKQIESLQEDMQKSEVRTEHL